jgi:hypothetical protein
MFSTKVNRSTKEDRAIAFSKAELPRPTVVVRLLAAILPRIQLRRYTRCPTHVNRKVSNRCVGGLQWYQISDFVDCIFEMYALNSETSSSSATVCRTVGTAMPHTNCFGDWLLPRRQIDVCIPHSKRFYAVLPRPTFQEIEASGIKEPAAARPELTRVLLQSVGAQVRSWGGLGGCRLRPDIHERSAPRGLR